ncbi:MAG: sulfurtransferase TusA family protein, partial [Thiohalorhabdaceae bacterium]
AVAREEDGTTTIDARGQTCPGYLLAINRAMDELEPGTTARLLVDYPPAEEDVRAWCEHRGYMFEGITGGQGGWTFVVRKS